MYNNEYRKWYLVIAVFAIISMFFGGSLAYWQWTTNTSERTSIALTVTEEFRCDADGGGDISSEEKYLVPTDCTNSEYAIQRTITVSPTIFKDTSITMDLWLDINSIDTGLRNSNNFKYALTTEADSCTSGVVKSGNFRNKTAGQSVPLFNFMGYNVTTTETYYLYIWLDKAETSTATMDQNFSLSLNGTCMNAPEPNTYVVFNEEDTTLRFYKRDDASQVSNNVNNYSVSRLDNNIERMEDIIISEEDKIYIELENTRYSSAEQLPWYEYKDNITSIIIEDEISPVSTAHWFDELLNVEYIDVRNLNTSNVTNMKYMFQETGYNVSSFEIVGLDFFDTSQVIDMNRVFQYTGKNATTFDIGDLSDWNTSNVTDMQYMFDGAGYNANTFNIGNLNNWDVSSVTDMGGMFNSAGKNATIWNIGNLSEWDVSNVTHMQVIFYNAGYSAITFDIGNLSEWDVSSVITMSGTFWGIGYSTTNFNIGNLSGWNVSNVENMSNMFRDAGHNATTFDIGNLLNWDVSKVQDMSYMFRGVGYNANTFNIGNLDNWDVSNVTNMNGMFFDSGRNATRFNIGDISGWDVSNVTDMANMFNSAGKNATTFDIGDLSKKTVTRSDGSTYIAWDTSSVTNMSGMFYQTGLNADYSLDLSNWNVSNVTEYGNFNFGVASKIIPPVWNTSS